MFDERCVDAVIRALRFSGNAGILSLAGDSTSVLSTYVASLAERERTTNWRIGENEFAF